MDELRAGSLLVVADVTVVPVERCSVQSGLMGARCWCYAHKEPVAVIIRDADGIRAFDTQGQAISVDSLLWENPELGTVLAPLVR